MDDVDGVTALSDLSLTGQQGGRRQAPGGPDVDEHRRRPRSRPPRPSATRASMSARPSREEVRRLRSVGGPASTPTTAPRPSARPTAPRRRTPTRRSRGSSSTGRGSEAPTRSVPVISCSGREKRLSRHLRGHVHLGTTNHCSISMVNDNASTRYALKKSLG